MLNHKRRNARRMRRTAPTRPVRPLRRPVVAASLAGGGHPLVRSVENERLRAYEEGVKGGFDAIVPVLKRISALQHMPDFEQQAQAIAQRELGFQLPQDLLADAWVADLDMRRLFAFCVFQTYRRFCDGFFSGDPLSSEDETAFVEFLHDCGFHTLDLSPCSDGRLAHVVRYVLRLPYRQVRRKSYAGALFDIEDSLAKWTEVELYRYREGRPTPADAPTRYLKGVVYHFSSSDPEHEGCAAHGSDTRRAAAAGLEKLIDFQAAVENSFCCGASVDRLLIGVDTDTDAIRLHVPDGRGVIDLEQWLDAAELYEATRGLGGQAARDHIAAAVNRAAPGVQPGMARLAARLLENNFSQIDYVRRYHGGRYPDIGHAERFIGAGIGFEEVQLRNLTYFAYLETVEEATADLDVGIKIFRGLNVRHGLPIPVVVRYDYHGHVPGARERALKRCRRVTEALQDRYAKLVEQGLLHTLQVVRDCDDGGAIEVLGCSVTDGLG